MDDGLGHGETLNARLSPADGVRRIGVAPPVEFNHAALCAVIDNMPDELATICRLLGSLIIAEIARTLGMRRQRIHELMPRIREYFVEAGFEEVQGFD